MSLQVWLPLNGNLENLGLGDVTVTNNGATVNTAGKIGSCYAGTATSQTIVATLPGLSDMLVNGKCYSLACWVKVVGTATNGWCVKLGTNSCGLWWAKSEARWVWNENDNGKRCANPTVSGDTSNWYHLVNVVDKTDSSAVVVRHYVNGEPAEDYNSHTIDMSSLTQPAGDIITITPYIANINDLRIYDHCLSAKEVKELSKGLIGHWPLNDAIGRENLIPKSQASVENYSSTSLATAHTEVVTEDGRVCYKCGTGNSSATSMVFAWGNSITLEANTTYTYSYWLKSNTAGSFNFTSFGHFQVQNNASTATDKTHEDIVANRVYSPSSIEADKWTKMSITFTTNSLDGSIFRHYPKYNLGTEVIVYICDQKLEKGSTATPWTPAPSDDLYSAMGLDDGIVYDTSGYGRNGYFGNSAFTTHDAVPDSPRYLVGTHLNSSNLNTYTDSTTADYIKVPFTLTSPDAFTIAVWANIKGSYNGAGHGLFASTKDGTGASTDYQKTLFNHRDNIVDVNSSDEANHIRPSLPITFNAWTHYVVTCDGLTAKTYKNGALQGSASFSSKTALGSMVNFYIGMSLAGGAYRKILGDYSDFRFYSTALSADDIKELYDISASVDKNGNFWGYELEEA